MKIKDQQDTTMDELIISCLTTKKPMPLKVRDKANINFLQIQVR